MPRIRKPKWVQLTLANFRVGLPVRVSPFVIHPACDWGNVSHDSVGVITDSKSPYSDIDLICDFPEQSGWNALMSEMEVLI